MNDKENTDILKKIAFQLIGIYHSDMTKAEKNITKILVERGLLMLLKDGCFHQPENKACISAQL